MGGHSDQRVGVGSETRRDVVIFVVLAIYAITIIAAVAAGPLGIVHLSLLSALTFVLSEVMTAKTKQRIRAIGQFGLLLGALLWVGAFAGSDYRFVALIAGLLGASILTICINYRRVFAKFEG